MGKKAEDRTTPGTSIVTLQKDEDQCLTEKNSICELSKETENER